MLFRNKLTKVVENVSNEMVIEQYVKRPNMWEQLDAKADTDKGLSYADLKAKATEMGLEFAGNIKKADLEQLIIDNEKPQE